PTTETGKLSMARAVCAPYRRPTGTSTDPIGSRSSRMVPTRLGPRVHHDNERRPRELQLTSALVSDDRDARRHIRDKPVDAIGYVDRDKRGLRVTGLLDCARPTA